MYWHAVHLLFLETSTQCAQPCGSDPDPHERASHSDRETGEGTGDVPPQHENRPACGWHAASPTAPPPQDQHQSTVQCNHYLYSISPFCHFKHCLIWWFDPLAFFLIIMFFFLITLDSHSHPWETPWDLETESSAAWQSEDCGGWWGMTKSEISALKGLPTLKKNRNLCQWAIYWWYILWLYWWLVIQQQFGNDFTQNLILWRAFITNFH